MTRFGRFQPGPATLRVLCQLFGLPVVTASVFDICAGFKMPLYDYVEQFRGTSQLNQRPPTAWDSPVALQVNRSISKQQVDKLIRSPVEQQGKLDDAPDRTTIVGIDVKRRWQKALDDQPLCKLVNGWAFWLLGFFKHRLFPS